MTRIPLFFRAPPRRPMPTILLILALLGIVGKLELTLPETSTAAQSTAEVEVL